MGMGKGAYLKKITSGMRWRSVELDEKMDGSSPPSVFIGKHGYPKVAIGPMIADYDESSIFDTPEQWIPDNKKQDEIINFRMELVRGKQIVDIHDLENRLVGKLQEISVADESVQSEAQFTNKPRGFTFDDEHQPFGPSARLDKFDISNVKWNKDLEYAYYDTDLKAREALGGLYDDGVLVSQMQKALSTGTMGIGKNRKLVPTRWSITAVDSSLANHLYDKVKYFDILEGFKVFEFSSLNNYSVLLMPTPWQYEWIEAFIHILGKEEMIFADHEIWKPKKEYSVVGGCYYSCKFGVLEGLHAMRRQAGAIVLREAYEGYVPLGVFNVRENVRNAMKEKPKEFDDFRGALNYVSTKLKLPISRFIDQGVLIKEMLKARQTTMGEF